MSRSRAAQRLSDFESSSVKLIAACALGLAGLATAQVSPPTRHALSVFTPSRPSDAPRATRLDAAPTSLKAAERR
ncbi:hypothetical protein [Hydrogenophaga sp.]